MKYIDAEKLIAEIEKRKQVHFDDYFIKKSGNPADYGASNALAYVLTLINSLQQEQPNNIIQWTGNNLKEVIDFTGKSPRFGEWFKSWEDFENYVHSHSDILKLFCEDGSHYEVPVGAWIVKTPDGYNVPSVAKYIQQGQLKMNLEKEIEAYFKDWSMNSYDAFFNEDGYKVSMLGIKNIARHFYELGLKRAAEMYDEIEYNRQKAEEE